MDANHNGELRLLHRASAEICPDPTRRSARASSEEIPAMIGDTLKSYSGSQKRAVGEFSAVPGSSESGHNSLGARLYSLSTGVMFAQSLLPLSSVKAPREASNVICETGDDDSDTQPRYLSTLTPLHVERRQGFPIVSPFDQAVTTLIVRNIPRRLDQSRLAEFWPPADSWNILYWPWSNSQRRHCFYAFINFVSNRAALAFHEKWHDRALMPHDSASSRPLKIGPADIQGVWPNLRLIHSKLVQTGEINFSRSQPIIIAPDGEVLDIASAMATATLVPFSV